MTEDVVEGVVAGDSDVWCNLAVIVPGRDDDVRHVRERELLILTADGRNVIVNANLAGEIRPERAIDGPWRELGQHPTRPPGTYHPDGHVKLKGRWIVPGDRIYVIGQATGHAFVPDTGGLRDAPQREVARIQAFAIGVGDDATNEAHEGLADMRKRAEQARKRASPQRIPWPLVVSIAFFVAAAALFITEVITSAGLFGLGLTCVFNGLLCAWWASPLQMFPGGAWKPDHEDDTTPPLITMMATTGSLALTVPMMFFLEDAAVRNAMSCMILMMVGVLVVGKLWLFGVLPKPRAEPGEQVHLPANKVMRWVLLVGLLVIVIVAAIIAFPGMSGMGDGGAV